MSARPLIPGRLYLVTARGLRLTVIADHPCTAILTALEHGL